jgi:proline dehydrogenase
MSQNSSSNPGFYEDFPMPVEAPTRGAVVEPNTAIALPPKRKTAVDFLPDRLVLTLASPYLAGRSAEQALAIAHRLYEQKHFTTTLDILGEDAHRDEDCEASVQNYLRLVDAVCANPLAAQKPREQMTISFKPSMFSVMAPKPGDESRKALDDAFDRIMRVVDYGAKNKINMTLEAEDHRWTNFHLEAYLALINAGYTNIGTVLQTRLFRTLDDIKRFDSRMRVRLVIGIYNEPSQIAYTDKHFMKQLVVEYAGELLTKGTYVEVASHDLNCIENFYTQVVIPQRISAYNFEHQFLQGVPRAKLENGLVSGAYFEGLKKKLAATDVDFADQLAQQGALVRMYLPYGTTEVSGAYCRRRLIENPNMFIFGIKNFLGIQ